MKQRLLRVLALLFAFAMVAAACGDSTDSNAEGEGDTAAEGEGGEEGGQEAGGVDEEAADEAMAGGDDEEEGDGEMADDEDAMEAPGSFEELEALWEANRQAVIDDIKANGYGLGDDGIVTGPAGFTIDTNDCPADWSNDEGVTDAAVLLGHTTALSGNLAAYGNIAAGMDSYFGYVNANGGIGGRDIELIAKDDAYVATQTIELVDELLQSDKPFAIETLGSPNTLAVYDTMNENCVPHPLAMTGHPAWGDPVGHPWTTGDQMSYATEAILWGAWIKNNMADQLPVVVAGLVMDNDFGLAYEDGMATYAEENPDVIAEFIPVRHDPAAPTVTNEMTTIASEEPDVFIYMTAGNPCLLAVEESGRSGLKDAGTVIFAPSVCKDPTSFLAPAGDVGDGFLIIGGGQKVCTDPKVADDPYYVFMQETLDGDGLDWAGQSNFCTGFGLFAWPYVEALRIADELDGGLNRTNFMIALRSMELQAPFMIEGISFGMNGNDDAFFIEGSDISEYDAASESWIISDIVDLNGSSPNCSWTDTGC